MILLRWGMDSHARLLHCRSTLGQISKEVQVSMHLMYLGDVLPEVPKRKNKEQKKKY